MKRPSARASAPALLAFLLILLTAAPALAEPWTFEKDKTDNDFYFTYDAALGTIPKAFSSARFNVRDKVDFLVYIREVPEALVGQRLKGRLELSLIKDKVVIYDGTFTLQIFSTMTEEPTEPIYTATSDQRIVLRPKRGMRKKAINLPFDLPSGDYSALATFQAS